jgi:uncharacterized protein
MKTAVENIVKAIARDPEAVEVVEEISDRSTVLRVKVAESDMGKLIGREGRTIKALRSLLFAASQKQGKRFILDVVE